MELPIPRIKDPISFWTAWSRKLITIRSVSSQGHLKSLSPDEFNFRMIEIQGDAVRTPDMDRKTAAFWKMENLASNFLKTAQPGHSLRDPGLPIEIRPIAHCGMGIAAVEVGGFRADRVAEIIDGFSEPSYRLFAYEGLGAMLALYEKDAFGYMSRACSHLGLIPLVPLDRPDERSFVSFFEPEIQRLIGHGYGRMLYFKHGSIAGALRSALRASLFNSSACVQGIAFAYSMVNNSDLERVFRAGENLQGATLRRAFENGLIYALEFWEWMAPGFLNRFAPRHPSGQSWPLSRGRRSKCAVPGACWPPS